MGVKSAGEKNHSSEYIQIAISTDAGFSNIIKTYQVSLNDESIGNTWLKSVFPGTAILNFSSTYFWRVTLFNEWESVQSQVFSFSTQSIPTPGKPELISPTLNAFNTPMAAEFNWTQVQFGDRYTLQIFSDPDLENPVFSTTVNEPGFTIDPKTLDFRTPYWWKVLAINDTYNTMNESGVSQFTTVDVLQPGVPDITSPFTAQSTTKYDRVEWTPTVNTDKYIVEIAKDETFQSLVQSAELTSNEGIAMDDSLPSGVYYVRARSENDVTGSDWSYHVGFSYENSNDPYEDPVSSETPEIEPFDLAELARLAGILASRIIYGLCDLDVMENAMEQLLEYEQNFERTAAVVGKKTYKISVVADPRVAYFFHYGYYRKPGNLVEFRVRAPQGTNLEFVTVDGHRIYSRRGVFSFEMPEHNTVVEIGLFGETEASYGLFWEERVCVANPVLFRLTWDRKARVCVAKRMPLALKWTSRVCVMEQVTELLAKYRLAWSQRVCVMESSEYVITWQDRICVASAAKMKFNLKWNTRVCVAKTVDYGLNWTGRICVMNKVLTTKK